MDEQTKPGTAPAQMPPSEPESAPPTLGAAEAVIWGSERPSEGPQEAPPAGPRPAFPPLPGEPSIAASAEAPPESPWWPVSPTPIPPSEPPPSHRGRVVAITLAVLLVAGGGAAGVVLATSHSQDAASPPTPSTSASLLPGPLIPAAPASFAAQAPTGGEVDLSWQLAPATTALTAYNVYREGQLVAQVAPTLSTYRDVDVVPETTYTYAIEAATAAGKSVQATLIVSTPKAPSLRTARVTGGFSIKGKFSKENFTNRDEGEKYASFWIFKPACSGDQACGVKTSGEGEGTSKLLRLKKGTYSGVVDIPGGGQCGSKKLTETQTISFTVTDAAFTDGVWLATKIAGTSRFNVPASLGCLAGFGTVTFTGAVSA